MTPLLIAAERGHEKVVKLLLSDERVDVNWRRHGINQTQGGATALIRAAERGRKNVVNLLLVSGRVDVN